MWRLATVVVLLSWTSTAHAEHPDIEAAREAYEATRFERAIALLGALEAGHGLRREDLVELYALRSLVHYAAGEREDMESDLTALASLDPSRILPTTYPPDFREAMEAARGRVGQGVSLRIDVDRREDGALFTAVPVGDVASLGRATRLHVRQGDDVEVVDDGHVERAWEGDVSLFAWAELVGPGGAVIATRGSEEAPVEVAPPSGDEAREESGSILGSPWLWTIVGVLLVGAGVAIAVGVASSGETETQLSGPAFVD